MHAGAAGLGTKRRRREIERERERERECVRRERRILCEKRIAERMVG